MSSVSEKLAVFIAKFVSRDFKELIAILNNLPEETKAIIKEVPAIYKKVCKELKTTEERAKFFKATFEHVHNVIGDNKSLLKDNPTYKYLPDKGKFVLSPDGNFSFRELTSLTVYQEATRFHFSKYSPAYIKVILKGATSGAAAGLGAGQFIAFFNSKTLEDIKQGLEDKAKNEKLTEDEIKLLKDVNSMLIIERINNILFYTAIAIWVFVILKKGFGK